MDIFHLAVGELLQGELRTNARTLLLVFQVNCPGCFSYALPLAEAIHRDEDRLGLSVLALSTAFEDFELNTLENTHALVDRGDLVGETQRTLGMRKYPGTISFPVATDLGMEHGVGETFTANRLMGTPSWIVLEPDRRVLSRHFGELPMSFANPQRRRASTSAQ